MMTTNSILNELRHTRERLLANAGGTLAGLVASLQQDERVSGRMILPSTELPRNRRLRECSEQPEEETRKGAVNTIK